MFISESSASICKFFQRGICYRDISCPFRHTSGPKTVVCKHWLRGLCKKVCACSPKFAMHMVVPSKIVHSILWEFWINKYRIFSKIILSNLIMIYLFIWLFLLYRETIASTSTSMTWPKCRSVTFSASTENAATRTASTFILTLTLKWAFEFKPFSSCRLCIWLQT